MGSSFLSKTELKKIGFGHTGENVKISRNSQVYQPELISLGNNVRIDDFCILSGKITIGSSVHISAYTALFGKAGITIEDFVSISSRVNVYSVNDDYSGKFLTNPTVPEDLRNVTAKPVILKKHVIIGAGSIILPGVVINDGAAVGALSLVNQSLDPWKIYAGIPCKSVKNRNRDLLTLEKDVIQKTTPAKGKR
jgi:acetyltransferase-like isoleucine patch superfamily enzyme